MPKRIPRQIPFVDQRTKDEGTEHQLDRRAFCNSQLETQTWAGWASATVVQAFRRSKAEKLLIYVLLIYFYKVWFKEITLSHSLNSDLSIRIIAFWDPTGFERKRTPYFLSMNPNWIAGIFARKFSYFSANDHFSCTCNLFSSSLFLLSFIYLRINMWRLFDCKSISSDEHWLIELNAKPLNLFMLSTIY